MSDSYHSMSLECYLSSMALYSRRLPPGYQIVLRFSQCGYTAVLLDPDGTQISCGVRQKFAVLCDIAQADAKRRPAP